MKRILLFLIVLCCISNPLFSESVSKEEVHRQAVAACMRIAEDDFSMKPYTITPMLEEGDTCYYVVQFVPEGYALIAADDRVQPLIGYSVTDQFRLENAPEPLFFLLKNRANQIKQVKESLCHVQRHSKWNPISLRSSSQSEKIGPLIKVAWDQAGYCSKYCPINKEGKKTRIGCVAIAMGQAMTVFQHPARPKGYKLYGTDEVGKIEVNFEEEAAYDWDKILSGADAYDEAARFLYHCGVSVKMEFAPDFSGAYISYISDALVKHFSYSSDSIRYLQMKYVTEDGYHKGYTLENWKEFIINELKQKRAVIYFIYDLLHVINIDGYDGVNAFHYNWGWGGYSNMYYTFEEEIGNVFNTNEDEMVIGLVPDTQSATSIESVAKSLELPIQVTGSLLRLKSPEKGICRIYNMSGVLLQTVPIVAGETEISLKTTGICILSVDCNGKVASHKIQVKE